MHETGEKVWAALADDAPQAPAPAPAPAPKDPEQVCGIIPGTGREDVVPVLARAGEHAVLGVLAGDDNRSDPGSGEDRIRPPKIERSTDEEAFAALGIGDVSVKVGEGPSLATWRLPDPDAVVDLFQRLVALRAATSR